MQCKIKHLYIVPILIQFIHAHSYNMDTTDIDYECYAFTLLRRKLDVIHIYIAYTYISQSVDLLYMQCIKIS